MRKIKKDKTISLNKITIIFVVAILFIGVGYSYLSQSLDVTGTANIVVDSECTTKENINVTHTSNSWYSNGSYYYQFDFVIENQNDSDLSDWRLQMSVPSDFNLSAAYTTTGSIDESTLTLIPKDYNSTIPAGTSITVSFQCTTSTAEFEPQGIRVNNQLTSCENIAYIEPDDPDDPIIDPDDPTDEPISDKHITYEVESSNGWQSGSTFVKQYNFRVTNTSSKNITSWYFYVDIPEGASITQNWGCEYINQDGLLKISNVSYNGNLKKDDSITFGIQISNSSDFDIVIR